MKDEEGRVKVKLRRVLKHNVSSVYTLLLLVISNITLNKITSFLQRVNSSIIISYREEDTVENIIGSIIAVTTCHLKKKMICSSPLQNTGLFQV